MGDDWRHSNPNTLTLQHCTNAVQRSGRGPTIQRAANTRRSTLVLGVWVQMLHEVKRSLGQVIKIFQLSPSAAATTTTVASSINHTSHTSIKSLYEDANNSAQRPHTHSSTNHLLRLPYETIIIQSKTKLLYDVADYDNEYHLDTGTGTGHSAGKSTCQLVGQGRHFKWFNVIVFEQICSTPEKERSRSRSLYRSRDNLMNINA